MRRCNKQSGEDFFFLFSLFFGHQNLLFLIYLILGDQNQIVVRSWSKEVDR